MVYRPRATLGRVVDDLGSTLLEMVAGQVDPETEVGGVVIHDPLDPPQVAGSALVLGVGLAGPENIVKVVHAIAAAGAVGLVIRAPVQSSPEVHAAAEQAGVVIFGLTRGASWAHVAAMLRSLLAVDDVAAEDGETLVGAGAGDLFALAGAVSALLDAPITIEDLNSRILAFSANQEQADESRKETILGRQVPARYMDKLEKKGIYRELYSSDRPVYIELADMPGIVMPRVAIRVVAGDEILGSMWAAVAGPLSPDREQALVDSAKLVSLHLLRHRAGADVERRLRAELVANLLEGGPAASAAAARLGVGDGRSCVLALALRDIDDASQLEAQLQRINGAFALHLGAAHPRSAVALVGGVVYGVLPLPHDSSDDHRAVAVAQEFLVRMGRQDTTVIGIGRVVGDAAALPRSRADADRALRVLRAGRAASQVARAEDVQTASLLLELGDLMAAEHQRPAGPLAQLAAYDARHRTEMVETLRAWLDAFGDISKAASVMHVHPNTFRYRLRRLGQLSGINLDDPEARFAAMLELRLSGVR